jgi:hypothetical protein
MTQIGCACGCGQPTKPARQTLRRCGHVKGQPVRWIKGHHHRRPLAERFWKKVEKQPGDGCWLWTGAKNSDGSGRILVGLRLVSVNRV